MRCVQKSRTDATYDEARRAKRTAETDAEPGDLRDLSRVTFGEHTREWIANYQGRTSNGFRESRPELAQLLGHKLLGPG